MKKTPERMCAVCRVHKDKRDLTRIVKNKEGEIFIDDTGKKNGRGAYICKDAACVLKAQKSKALERSFKIAVPSEVYDKLLGEADG